MIVRQSGALCAVACCKPVSHVAAVVNDVLAKSLGCMFQVTVLVLAASACRMPVVAFMSVRRHLTVLGTASRGAAQFTKVWSCAAPTATHVACIVVVPTAVVESRCLSRPVAHVAVLCDVVWALHG